MGAVLSLGEVRQRRGGREVLRVDELDIAASERLAVLGPNGSGKTTLLRLLAAIDMPVEGTVLVDGVPTTPGAVELRRRVAYAAQRPGLLTTSVRRNVELPLRWRRVGRAERRESAGAALERLGVAHLADRSAAALSAGEAQRVNLARALALDPALLLLDEPAAALDAESRAAFLADVERALDTRGPTVVHVSHRPEEVLRMAGRVAVLVDGAIRQLTTPDALLRAPADATVARLVGYENVLEAEAGDRGEVLVGGRATGLTCPAGAGAVTVAVGRRASCSSRRADRGYRRRQPTSRMDRAAGMWPGRLPCHCARKCRWARPRRRQAQRFAVRLDLVRPAVLTGGRGTADRTAEQAPEP